MNNWKTTCKRTPMIPHLLVLTYLHNPLTLKVGWTLTVLTIRLRQTWLHVTSEIGLLSSMYPLGLGRQAARWIHLWRDPPPAEVGPLVRQPVRHWILQTHWAWKADPTTQWQPCEKRGRLLAETWHTPNPQKLECFKITELQVISYAAIGN